MKKPPHPSWKHWLDIRHLLDCRPKSQETLPWSRFFWSIRFRNPQIFYQCTEISMDFKRFSMKGTCRSLSLTKLRIQLCSGYIAGRSVPIMRSTPLSFTQEPHNLAASKAGMNRFLQRDKDKLHCITSLPQELTLLPVHWCTLAFNINEMFRGKRKNWKETSVIVLTISEEQLYIIQSMAREPTYR
jgi:hypothetical protein